MAVGDSDAALHDGEASWRGDASKREGVGGRVGERARDFMEGKKPVLSQLVRVFLACDGALELLTEVWPATPRPLNLGTWDIHGWRGSGSLMDYCEVRQLNPTAPDFLSKGPAARP